MLAFGWVIAAVVLAVLLTSWVVFTATRLDRLHARVDAALAALDVQLVRRAAAVRHVLETGRLDLDPADQRRYVEAACVALTAGSEDRERAENELGRVVVQLANAAAPGAYPAGISHVDAVELHEAGVRVIIARRFYNDAVRDTRGLRSGLMPRILRLAGHREVPRFFDIDDTFTFPDPTQPVSAQPVSAQPVPSPQRTTQEFTP